MPGTDGGGTVNMKLLLGVALGVIGLALALISALAEPLGLGDPTATFGWKQIVGLALGGVFLITGVVVARRGARRETRNASQP
jgi:hypothetical protein